MGSDSGDKDTFFEIYEEYFIGAYSDIVIFTSEKPLMVLNEFEGAFTHLMKYQMEDDPDINLKKAKGHIFRATLDCYKMLWRETHSVVSEIDMYRGAYEKDEKTLVNSLYQWDEISMKARLAEHNSVGSEDVDILNLWKEAARLSLEIYKSVNKTSLKKLKRKAKYEGPFKAYVFPVILAVAAFLLGKFI